MYPIDPAGIITSGLYTAPFRRACAHLPSPFLRRSVPHPSRLSGLSTVQAYSSLAALLRRLYHIFPTPIHEVQRPSLGVGTLAGTLHSTHQQPRALRFTSRWVKSPLHHLRSVNVAIPLPGTRRPSHPHRPPRDMHPLTFLACTSTLPPIPPLPSMDLTLHKCRPFPHTSPALPTTPYPARKR